MAPWKFLIPFVMVSLAGHALVLGLTTGVVRWNAPPSLPKAEKVMSVALETSVPGDPRVDGARPRFPSDIAALSRSREDTVSLQDEATPYDAYLQAIRRKIEARWRYPPQALSGQEEGDTLVRFSIEANGRLAEVQVVASSGSPALDNGALTVVQGAAPYGPFPETFRLNRLHITATFRYRIGAGD